MSEATFFQQMRRRRILSLVVQIKHFERSWFGVREWHNFGDDWGHEDWNGLETLRFGLLRHRSLLQILLRLPGNFQVVDF